MKCPIKLSLAVAQYIKEKDLVYIGVGNRSDMLVKDGKIVCESLRVMPDGTAGNGCNMTNHFGGREDNHYFIRRSDAKTHFPHCLPQHKPRPKLRLELVKEELAAAKARIVDLESKIASAKAALS